MLPCQLIGNTKLVGEHKFCQLQQYAVLGVKNIVECTVGYISQSEDLCIGGSAVPLFNKQTNAYRKNPSFGVLFIIPSCYFQHRFLLDWIVI